MYRSLAVALAASLCSFAFAQDAKPGLGVADEMDDIGMTLKAAVKSGALESEDAIRMWRSLGGDMGDDKGASLSASPKAAYVRLEPPRPGQMLGLLRPDFFTRDLELLGQELDLSRDQAAIVALLLKDYEDAFEFALAPLRETMNRYREVEADRWMATKLEQLQAQHAAQSRDRATRVLKELERVAAEKDLDPEDAAKIREKRDAWEERMVQVSTEMDERLEALRARAEARMKKLAATDQVTAADVLAAARVFRDERERLRRETTEALSLIGIVDGTDEQVHRFEASMARLRVVRATAMPRLAGETVDPWASLDEARHVHGVSVDALEFVEMVLDDDVRATASLFDQREVARLDRELKGFEVLAARDEAMAEHGLVDVPAVERVTEAYQDAARREVSESARARDALLSTVQRTREQAAELDAAFAATFRDAAYRRGFRVDMRPRWCERALDAALRLELDHETREVVSVVETGADESLRELRDRCVDQRLQHEPEWALARIGAAEHAYAWEEVAGFETEQFEALDMQVDGRLRAILTPEQYETLPRRPWDREKKLESKDVDAKKAIERKNGLGNSRTKAAPGKGG